MAASSFALGVLSVLAVAAPWAFGSVDPLPRFLLVLTALAGGAIALAASSRGSGLLLPDLPLWPLGGLVALGFAQLAPLPASVLRRLAPGSAEVWYPAAAVARGVLGEGPRPVSVDPASTLAGLLLAGGLLGLGLLAVPALTLPRPALRAATLLALGGALLAVYGIVARNRFGALLYGQLAVPTVSPFGPFVSKNHFAGYVAPASLLALGLAMGLADRARDREWTRGRSAPAVVLALLAAVLMALALFVSQSRGGAVAAVAGLLAFVALVVTRGSRVRTFAPVALVAVALVLALGLVLPEAARARVTTLEGASFRLDTWRDGLSLARRSPAVGQGFSAFADAFPRAKRGHGEILVEHAENEYVELLVEGGALGLALAVLAFLLPARRLAGPLHRLEPSRRGLALGGLAGLVALAAHSAFDFNLRIPSNATLAALLAGFAAAGVALRPEALPPLLPRVLALLFAAGAAGVAVRGPGLFDRGAVTRAARAEVRAAAVSSSPEVRRLRVERAGADLRRLLGARPALAEGWLLLAALARESGDGEAAQALAGHAILLDPSRGDLTSRARALSNP